MLEKFWLFIFGIKFVRSVLRATMKVQLGKIVKTINIETLMVLVTLAWSCWERKDLSTALWSKLRWSTPWLCSCLWRHPSRDSETRRNPGGLRPAQIFFRELFQVQDYEAPQKCKIFGAEFPRVKHKINNSSWRLLFHGTPCVVPKTAFSNGYFTPERTILLTNKRCERPLKFVRMLIRTGIISLVCFATQSLMCFREPSGSPTKSSSSMGAS